MASPDAIRKALINLMGAKAANKGKPASERAFRTQFEDVDDYGNPTVREQVNQVPTAQQSIEATGQGEWTYGTFADDPKSLAVREARQKAKIAQGNDALEPTRDMFYKTSSPEEMVRARATAKTFEEVVGRPPSSYEFSNPGAMERVIESVSGPNKAATLDDIPF